MVLVDFWNICTNIRENCRVLVLNEEEGPCLERELGRKNCADPSVEFAEVFVRVCVGRPSNSARRPGSWAGWLILGGILLGWLRFGQASSMEGEVRRGWKINRKCGFVCSCLVTLPHT